MDMDTDTDTDLDLDFYSVDESAITNILIDTPSESVGGDNEGGGEEVERLRSKAFLRNLRLRAKNRLRQRYYLVGNSGEDGDPSTEEDNEMKWKLFTVILTVLQWMIFIGIIGALIFTYFIHYLREPKLFDINLLKWELLLLVLLCGRLMSGWGIGILVFLIEKKFFGRMLSFVYGLRNSLQNCLWVGLIMIVWHVHFSELDSKFKFVGKIFVCFLAATLLWLVNIILSEVKGYYFCVNHFFDKTQEYVINGYVIESIWGPPLPFVGATATTGEE